MDVAILKQNLIDVAVEKISAISTGTYLYASTSLASATIVGFGRIENYVFWNAKYAA